jgi:hypothetical protein
MQNPPMDSSKTEIAATAARLVVEEGLEYGPAKRRAVKQLGLNARTPLPDNDDVEDAVREYIALFCADTQPGELRPCASWRWSGWSAWRHFAPSGGAVWHGTATRLSDIHIQLFCDDSKSAEIALIDHNVAYEPAHRHRLSGRAGGGAQPVQREPGTGRGHWRSFDGVRPRRPAWRSQARRQGPHATR